MAKLRPPFILAALVVCLLCVETDARMAPHKTIKPLTRTFVSGQGNDDNPCTVSAPCRTLQGALRLTLPSGELFVLDSADYGPVTIDKAVSITSEGASAGVLAANGSGVRINAGPNDVVYLRGLTIDGGETGQYGISFISGQALHIQRSSIRGFSTGINFSPTTSSVLLVSNTQLTNNSNHGVLFTSNGSNVANGALNRVTTSWNGVGILAQGTGTTLILSELDGNNNTYGIGASGASVMVRNSTVSNNAVGMAAEQTGTIRVSQSALTANQTGWQSSAGGKVLSYGNNNVSGNVNDGVVTATVSLN